MAKDTFFSKKQTLNIGGRLIVPNYPLVMAIINVTPDSFYTQSRAQNELELISCVEKAIYEGASIIDIGAYSSRPNALDIDIDEEKKRLSLALNIVKNKFPNIWVSVDTFRSEVVRWAYNDFGISLVNDISGGLADERMFRTIVDLNIPYILMHMRGTSQNMQSMCNYENVTKDVIFELSRQFEKAKIEGVSDLIIDPGFGFSKNMEQNYELLKNLSAFKCFERPIMVGISRKSMIWKLLESSPDNALNGSTVLNTIALLNGADIIRVHDVKEAIEAIKLVSKFHNAN